MTRAEVQAVASKHIPTLRQSPIYQGYQAEEDRIVILVSRKPKPGQLPTTLDNIPVEYRVVGELGIMSWTERERPAIGGLSISHPDVTVGTLGSIVTIGGKPYIISNNHVIANCNNASKGDSIYQPGVYDGGSEDDTIGYLYSWKWLVDEHNKIDFAVAEAIPDLVDTLIKATRPAPPELLVDPDTYAVELSKGDSCFKCGRTTELTRGKVEFASANDVKIGGYPQGTLSFDDVVIVQSLETGAWVKGGDSGSPTLTPDGKLAGLVFAGNAILGIGIYCKIQNILEWIWEEFRFRPASYTASRAWVPAFAGISMVSGGVSVGARRYK